MRCRQLILYCVTLFCGIQGLSQSIGFDVRSLQAGEALAVPVQVFGQAEWSDKLALDWISVTGGTLQIVSENTVNLNFNTSSSEYTETCSLAAVVMVSSDLTFKVSSIEFNHFQSDETALLEATYASADCHFINVPPVPSYQGMKISSNLDTFACATQEFTRSREAAKPLISPKPVTVDLGHIFLELNTASPLNSYSHQLIPVEVQPYTPIGAMQSRRTADGLPVIGSYRPHGNPLRVVWGDSGHGESFAGNNPSGACSFKL